MAGEGARQFFGWVGQQCQAAQRSEQQAERIAYRGARLTLVVEDPQGQTGLAGGRGHFATGAQGQDTAAAFEASLEGSQGLFGVPGVRGGDEQRLRAARPGGKAVIAVDNQRQRAVWGGIGGQQVGANRRAAHAGDDHALDAGPRGKRLAAAQLPGALQLVGQAVNLRQVVLGVNLGEVGKIIKIHRQAPLCYEFTCLPAGF